METPPATTAVTTYPDGSKVIKTTTRTRQNDGSYVEEVTTTTVPPPQPQISTYTTTIPPPPLPPSSIAPSGPTPPQVFVPEQQSQQTDQPQEEKDVPSPAPTNQMDDDGAKTSGVNIIPPPSAPPISEGEIATAQQVVPIPSGDVAEQETPPAPPPSKVPPGDTGGGSRCSPQRKKLIVLLAVVLVVIGGAGAGVGIAMSGGGDDDESSASGSNGNPSPSPPSPSSPPSSSTPLTAPTPASVSPTPSPNSGPSPPGATPTPKPTPDPSGPPQGVPTPTRRPTPYPTHPPTPHPTAAPVFFDVPACLEQSCEWRQLGEDFAPMGLSSIAASGDLKSLVLGYAFHDQGSLDQVGILRTYQQTQEGGWSELAGSPMVGTATSDRLGEDVDLSEDGKILALHEDDDVVVYHRNSVSDANWIFSQLRVPGSVELFGLSGDGTVLVVFYSNSIQTYRRSDSSDYESWEKDSGSIQESPYVDWAASRVAVSEDGSLFAVATGTSTSRVVAIYRWVTTSWIKTFTIPSDGSYSFGGVIAISGNGSALAITGTTGKVHTYQFNLLTSSWDPTNALEYFEEGGGSLETCTLTLSDNGKVLVIGNHDYDNNYIDGSYSSGAIETYQFDASSQSWIPLDVVKGIPTDSGVGRYVALSSDGSSVVAGGSSLLRLYNLFFEGSKTRW